MKIKPNSKFKADYVRRAELACQTGMTDFELAQLFEVTEATICNKIFGQPPGTIKGQYTPPICVGMRKSRVEGNPDLMDRGDGHPVANIGAPQRRVEERSSASVFKCFAMQQL